MLVNLRSLAPPSICGPTLVDNVGLPRFWADVWASFLPADLAPATVSKKLGYLESFYQHADTLFASEVWIAFWPTSMLRRCVTPLKDTFSVLGIPHRSALPAKTAGKLRFSSLRRIYDEGAEITQNQTGLTISKEG
jgi:hypothetical protein